MTNPQDGSLVLRRRLESLPRELYDIIYDLTFNAEPGVRRLGTIDRDVKDITPPADPRPSMLGVSRRIREQYALSYYGRGATFIVYDDRSLVAWLALLPEAHRDMVADVGFRLQPRHHAMRSWNFGGGSHIDSLNHQRGYNDRIPCATDEDGARGEERKLGQR